MSRLLASSIIQILILCLRRRVSIFRSCFVIVAGTTSCCSLVLLLIFINLVGIRILVFKNLVSDSVCLSCGRFVIILSFLSLIHTVSIISLWTIYHVFVLVSTSTTTCVSTTTACITRTTLICAFTFIVLLVFIYIGIDSGVFLSIVLRLISFELLSLLSLLNLRAVNGFCSISCGRSFRHAWCRLFNVLNFITGLFFTLRPLYFVLLITCTFSFFFSLLLLFSFAYGRLSSLILFKSLFFSNTLLLTISFNLFTSLGLFSFSSFLLLFILELSLLLNSLMVSDLFLSALSIIFFFSSLGGLPLELFKALILFIGRVFAELLINSSFVKFALVTDSGNVIFVEFDTQVLTSISLLSFKHNHLLISQGQFDNAIIFFKVLISSWFLPSVVVVAAIVIVGS